MYQALQKHFRTHGPPAHLAIAIANGWKPEDEAAEDRIEDPDQLAALLASFPGGVAEA